MSAREEDLITLSAEESAELAGVSLDTIDKYVQIGLLTPVNADNSNPQFLESDIRSLFYTKQSSSSLDSKLAPSSQELAEEEVPQQADISTQEIETTEQDEIDTESLEIEPEPNHIVDNVVVEEVSEQTSDVSQEQVDHIQVEPASTAETTNKHNQTEDLLNLTVALREQIETLKEERNWLRDRVEQLERRGEREQMLLLSESETVRRLVSQKSIAERFIQTLKLPWVQPK